MRVWIIKVEWFDGFHNSRINGPYSTKDEGVRMLRKFNDKGSADVYTLYEVETNYCKEIG